MGKLKDFHEREIAEMALEEALRCGDYFMQGYNESRLRDILRSRDYTDEEIALVIQSIWRKAGIVEPEDQKAIGKTAGRNDG